jgi:hypothetical protein
VGSKESRHQSQNIDKRVAYHHVTRALVRLFRGHLDVHRLILQQARAVMHAEILACAGIALAHEGIKDLALYVPVLQRC